MDISLKKILNGWKSDKTSKSIQKLKKAKRIIQAKKIPVKKEI